MPEYLYRRDPGQRFNTQYRVTISLQGPRGGKRAPLIDAEVWAESYDDAHGFVQQRLLKRCRHTVVA